MTAVERKQIIIEELEKTDTPINATQLATKLSVSRQVIVGDIAILRASGRDIVATPKGYLLQREVISNFSIACNHSSEDTLQELYTIVDNGCAVLNVIVEHQVYGQIVGELQIYSRKDADDFVENMKKSRQEPLSALTEQVHLHTIHCPSQKHYEDVKDDLKKQGFLINEG